MRTSILLSFFILCTTISGFSQTKRSNCEFDKNKYFKTIQAYIDSIKLTHEIKWIYCRAAKIDTVYYLIEEAPAPHFITTIGFTDFVIDNNEINNIDILCLSLKELFVLADEKENSRKELFGEGMVFSLPYYSKYDNRKFIAAELINWSNCGTGCEIDISFNDN